MASAAVDEKQIRPSLKSGIAFLRPLKAAVNHFLHAAVVIRPVYRSYFEFTVGLAVRLSVFKDDHSSHGIYAADIGNIVGFDPPGTGRSAPPPFF